jgi:hypothetical protein
MFDQHDQLISFFQAHVHLSNKKRAELAGYRDINLARLREGLDNIGEEDGVTYSYWLRDRDQGSYAMHTMIQSRTGEYDIDEGLIFDEADLPSTPLASRRRIVRAFNTLNIKFKKPPEARTNAVTIWYADGYHVDFAIYRERTDDDDQKVCEHAGPTWKTRDPQEITDWFCEKVNEVSPKQEDGATVEDGQLRRLVCLLKAFAKSRDDWNMPGGFIITNLAVECYRPDQQRDDVALYNTMRAIRNRLLLKLEVFDPIHPEQELTDREKYKEQVGELRDKLMEALNELQALFHADCDATKAASAWNWVFQHSFWNDLAATTDKSFSSFSWYGSSRPRVEESPPFA